jgi:hypothetical protein
VCGCSEANFQHDPTEKQPSIQSESEETSDFVKTEPSSSDEFLTITQEESEETSEVVKTEPASSYQYVMSGTINTGNPHPNTVQTFEYYYYALNDDSTPSEAEVREIMADLFADLGLIREETASYGIFLWPTLGIAEANILYDSDWSAVRYRGDPLYTQAVGTLTNHGFYDHSDYIFTYYGYSGDFMKGESWWFDGDEERYFTSYN